MEQAALTTNSKVQPTVATKQSKQSRYYYRHPEERRAYQKQYDAKHKQHKRQYDKQRYQSNKVKSVKNNISVLPDIRIKSYSLLKNLDRAKVMDAYFHSHGRPKGKRIYAKPRRAFWFHVSPDLAYIEGKPFILMEGCERKDVTTFHQLMCQLSHCLGFKLGDSLVWKQANSYTGKVETHTVCFDRSGIDLSHKDDLMRLMEFRIEHDVKGYDMMILFANKHSVNNYLQVWRGNRLLETTNTESALKDYRKHYFTLVRKHKSLMAQ